MKILFLDIDGVIISIRSAYAKGGSPWKVDISQAKYFDSVGLALIQRLCKETGAEIVISSMWRTKYDVKTLADVLGLPIIDTTPVDVFDGRGVEINEWMERHPEVETYAIVDDDDSVLDFQLPFFVKTRSRDGLLFDDYNKLREILTPEAPRP